jgi:hypothetical protein
MWFSADTAVSSTNNNARHDITKKFAMVALNPIKQPNQIPIVFIIIHIIRVITKLPNAEQSYKGKVKTHKNINRQNQLTTGKL